ncbi:MAG: DUF4881 domain-containing protein [Bryobacteraceae bacterium]
MKRFVLIVAAAVALTSCGRLGYTAQGRVIAYDRQTRRMTVIQESPVPSTATPGILPAVTIVAPVDPAEMGPAPVAGGLMLVDAKKHRLVVYDRDTQSFRTIQYAPLEERRISNIPAAPIVDRVHQTITVYSRKDRLAITFRAASDLLALPAGTWQSGDVVRYYYKDPSQALRLMNVTQTDLSRSAG